MSDLLPELSGISAVQALPSILDHTRALAAPTPLPVSIPQNIASGQAAVLLMRPLVRAMSDARDRRDSEAFNLARTDFLAAASTATALDVLQAADTIEVAKRVKLPAVQRVATQKIGASAGALLALAWLTDALRPENDSV